MLSAQIWQTKWQIYPLGMAILQYEISYLIPTLRAHMWQIRWQPTLQNGDFRFLLMDYYSESSDMADQVTDLPPGIEILQYETSYLIPTLRAQVWQTRWHIYPPKW